MPGPPPKPTALKLLDGNPGQRPINKREPQPRTGHVPCPSWLDPEARKAWHRVAPELRRLGLLTVIDGDALAYYCQCWARWRAADDAGDAAKAKLYAVGLERMMAQFGMTPASRSRIQLADAARADTDPMAALLD